MVKNLPAMQETQETQVWSLGQEDPLEKGMATLSSILAWRIPWTEEPGGLQPMGSQRVRHDWGANTYIHVEVDGKWARQVPICSWQPPPRRFVAYQEDGHNFLSTRQWLYSFFQERTVEDKENAFKFFLFPGLSFQTYSIPNLAVSPGKDRTILFMHLRW